jgi:glycosyltransferase involved in cell wall biosynthesis
MGPIRRGYVEFRRSLQSINILGSVQQKELTRLVKKLNRRVNMDVWYVPSMFWPEVGGLKGAVVMAAPDIVFYEHPAQYISGGLKNTWDRMRGSLDAADHLISYSDYVKQHHLVERQNIPAERVSVIRHGAIDMRAVERGDGTKAAALEVLHKYLKDERHSLPSYLNGFRFDDVDFLFYSSQVRFHKNIEGLILVYERTLRQHFRPVKLVLTGHIATSDRISSLVADRGLHRDVISLPSVPNHVLAALYRLALLSVTPTMFEGGFPFTFSEAFSVGTPSIMSRIPVVTEVIKDTKLLELMTFDPRNREEMLQKILWGIDHRAELLTAQEPLYQVFSARSWLQVSHEYLDLIISAAQEPKRIGGQE